LLGDLSEYQDKVIKIDDHVGLAYSGLSSDARVLSNQMRTLALKSRMVMGRPMPTYQLVSMIADKAQVNTQKYGARPYGVGFLVAGWDAERGQSHIWEFSPSGNFFDYRAMSIGGRAQSAKTYLEKHVDEFDAALLDPLIQHGLLALRDTLQQDKALTSSSVSIAFVGKDTPFTKLENDQVAPYLTQLDSLQGGRRTDEVEPAPEAMETDA
jgi:20S proteasome subunit alpha 6